MAKKSISLENKADVLLEETQALRNENQALHAHVNKLLNTKFSFSDQSIAEYKAISDTIESNINQYKQMLTEKEKIIPKWAFIALMVGFAITGLAIIVAVSVVKIATS